MHSRTSSGPHRLSQSRAILSGFFGDIQIPVRPWYRPVPNPPPKYSIYPISLPIFSADIDGQGDPDTGRFTEEVPARLPPGDCSITMCSLWIDFSGARVPTVKIKNRAIAM